MHVLIKKLLLSVAVAAMLGYIPVWCDSCGEMRRPDEMTACAECGAEICEPCATSHEGAGCWCCDD